MQVSTLALWKWLIELSLIHTFLQAAIVKKSVHVSEVFCINPILQAEISRQLYFALA
jgi:hypothetical protein